MEKITMGWDSRLEVDLNIDDLLMQVRYNIDARGPHIVLNNTTCQGCGHRSCLYVCPVRAYRWEEDHIALHCERCMECGACLHVCDRSALIWGYPKGGFGVCFRLG
jgi:ferredoxin like protein